GAVESTDEVGGIMLQDGPQPAEPFRLGAALKPRDAAVRVEQRLLHQIGRVHFRPQPALHVRLGDDVHIIPARSKECIERLLISLASTWQQFSNGSDDGGHHDPPMRFSLEFAEKVQKKVACRSADGYIRQHKPPGNTYGDSVAYRWTSQPSFR